MMTRTLFSRCATVAIAASVAVPAIPALAQDAVTADPVIVLPSEPAPATAPSPQIVLPEPVSAPTAAPINVPEVPAPVVTTTVNSPATTAPRATAATTRTPVAAAPRVASESRAPTAEAQTTDSALAATTATSVSAQSSPTVAEPQPTVAPPATAVDSSTDELALAGVLGALGLAAVGGIAFAASRRRRNRVASGEVYEPVAYERIDEPIIEEPVAIAPEPMVRQPAYTAPVAAAPVFARTRSNGDPVALPAALPESFEERDALLRELVDAKPDRANPFTSPGARARRAKLIMQSLGRSFTSRKPRIDLSEYTNRWPSLRGWQPATA